MYKYFVKGQAMIAFSVLALLTFSGIALLLEVHGPAGKRKCVTTLLLRSGTPQMHDQYEKLRVNSAA